GVESGDATGGPAPRGLLIGLWAAPRGEPPAPLDVVLLKVPPCASPPAPAALPRPPGGPDALSPWASAIDADTSAATRAVVPICFLMERPSVHEAPERKHAAVSESSD